MGQRPLQDALLDNLPSELVLSHASVRPGLTGHAIYVSTRSVSLDLQILGRTSGVVLRGEGAY